MSFTIGLFGPGVGLGFDLDLDNFSDTLEHWGDPWMVSTNIEIHFTLLCHVL